MANLYADENFPLPAVVELRHLGHDVLRAQEAGQAGQGIPDSQVLSFAVSQVRAVITLNYRHFVKLHKQTANHSGIVVCTRHTDFLTLAERIHQALLAESSLTNQLIRVNKPNVP